MTLEKAIEILEASFHDPWVAPKDDFGDAIKLGIEGLKRIQRMRFDNAFLSPPPLPGETKE